MKNELDICLAIRFWEFLFDLLVGSGFVAVGTKLLDFQPFGCVSPVLLSGIPRYTLGPLGGVGPAFSALESDHDPDALAFCHKGRDAAVAKR